MYIGGPPRGKRTRAPAPGVVKINEPGGFDVSSSTAGRSFGFAPVPPLASHRAKWEGAA
jgi:hypothetical protein